MTSPYSDYYLWLNEMADNINQGRWEEVDLTEAAEVFHGRAREAIQELQGAIRQWLLAGARGDNRTAREAVARVRDRLTSSPSLSEYTFLREQVSWAWESARKELVASGERCPRIGTEDLDLATGRIRRGLPFDPPRTKSWSLGKAQEGSVNGSQARD